MAPQQPQNIGLTDHGVGMVGPEARGLFEPCQRLVRQSGAQQCRAVVAQCRDVVRLERDGSLMMRERLARPALTLERIGVVRMRFRKLRIQGNRPLIAGEGLVLLAAFCQGHSQVAVGDRVVRIQGDGPPIRVDCRVRLSDTHQSAT